MDKVLEVLPASWRPYAKSIVGLAGLVATVVVFVTPTDQVWTTVVSVLTFLGVYAVPNDTIDTTAELDGPLTDEIEGPGA